MDTEKPQDPGEGPAFTIRYTDASAPSGSGRTQAHLMGLIASLAAGFAWMWIVKFSGYELGMVAWGIGGLVGWVMSNATTDRDPALGAAAVAFSVLGLIAGKVLIAQFVLAGSIASELTQGDEMLASAAFWEAEETGDIPDDLRIALDAMPEGDTLSDALWAQMLELGEARLAAMDDQTREELALGFSEGIVGSVSLVQRVLWQLSLFDALWLFLAASTAWKMTAKEEQVVAAV